MTRAEFLALSATLTALTVPSAEGQPERPIDLGNLFPEVDALAGPPHYSLSFTGGGTRTLEEFHRLGRGRILDLLGYRPAPVDPAPQVIERVDRGDHIREKVTFATGPAMRVPAYVLIPKGHRGRGPAMVDLHSHGGMYLYGKEKVIDMPGKGPALTKYHAENYAGRPTATELVKRGYVVISIDAFPFGERRIQLDPRDRETLSVEEARALNRRLGAKESTVVKGLATVGFTWPGIVFWDDMRTVDYLRSRPEVDPDRIGCVGISMGGYRSLYLAALDERIRAGCVTGFLSTIRPMLRAHLDTHSFVHFLPGLHAALDLPDVATLTAPRPLLVQQCSRDGLFTLDGMKAAVSQIAAGYKKAGAAERFSGRFYDEPHHFTVAMQEEAFAFLDRHLRS